MGDDSIAVAAVGVVLVFCFAAVEAVDVVAVGLIRRINSPVRRSSWLQDSDCNLTALCRGSLSSLTALKAVASFDNTHSSLDRQLNWDLSADMLGLCVLSWKPHRSDDGDDDDSDCCTLEVTESK